MHSPRLEALPIFFEKNLINKQCECMCNCVCVCECMCVVFVGNNAWCVCNMHVAHVPAICRRFL